MGRHAGLKQNHHIAQRAGACAATTAALLIAPFGTPTAAFAVDVQPTVTSVEAIDPGVQHWVDECLRLGFSGVPDAPEGELEVPWFAYDEDGNLFAVRPWDNAWATYKEYLVQLGGVWYWKVTAEANAGHKFTGAYPTVWKADPASPQRFATFLVPLYK